MYKLLGGLSKYLKRQEIITDSVLFRLHNHFTTVLLFTCSLLVTATQYVGNPISCIVQGLPTNPINTYCWITSTFTMPDAFNRQVCDFRSYLFWSSMNVIVLVLHRYSCLLKSACHWSRFHNADCNKNVWNYIWLLGKKFFYVKVNNSKKKY